MPLPFTIFRDEDTVRHAKAVVRQRNHVGNRSDCQRFMERHLGTPNTILTKLLAAHEEIHRLRILVENPTHTIADEATPRGDIFNR